MMANCDYEELEEMDDDLEEDVFSPNIQQWKSMPLLNSDAKERYNDIADRSPEDSAKFPKHIKLMKNTDIGDVIKERALAFLPAKSLYRFKTVSKEWDQWINNPFFVHMQTTQFKEVSGLFCQPPGESPSFISLDPTAFGIPSEGLSFLPEPVDIRTTCNGLICCQGRGGDQAYYICNPVNKEWRMLPKPKLYHGPQTAIALAFEPAVFNFNANYELICVVNLPDTSVLCFEIYSSRTDSWRISETVCFELNSVALNGDGFYMKGYAYWETQCDAILAFDVKYETYGMFSLPPCREPTGALTEIRGNLFYLMPRKQDECSIEVYGDISMSLKHVIPLDPKALGNTDGLCRALSFVNDDTFILDLEGKIIAYNATSHKVECLRNARNYEGFAKYLPYVNSLVTVSRPVFSKWEDGI
ncbi:hypothetical protein P3X46_029296 [Hevea brasiliensis]|uniref:F-box associated beta-propeller type 1 domain-containing protein n=1 Tax=Hevea brasiliensis TaxID=3981 RepID=A0ABQ9KTN9_HEVBR|nr:F-box protein At5g49610 [Hevea brasiliensis]KAJ9147094.1 hypothetical protein P3X46_029296 [Hevea brasiliensis]